MALVVGGGYAEYCLAHESHALPVPPAFDGRSRRPFRRPSSPSGTTCSSAARLKAGETLLVHGGSSGIGTTAIQLAKAFGARVIATAGSAEKCEACRKLGADVAINYKTEDFVAATKAATGGKRRRCHPRHGRRRLHRRAITRPPPSKAASCRSRSRAGPKATVDFRRIMLKRLHHTGSTLRAALGRRQGRDRARRRGQRAAADRRRQGQAGDRQDLPAGARRPPPMPVMETSAHIGKIVLTV